MDDRSVRVFIVDDDDAVRDSLSLLVQLEGYEVESFAGADEFLAAVERGRPDCAVIDVNMPGMDGLELQRELARRGNRLPIIFLTGYADPSANRRAVRGGAVDFLTKPVTGENLLRAIAAAIAAEEHGRARSPRSTGGASRSTSQSAPDGVAPNRGTEGSSNAGAGPVTNIGSVRPLPD